MRYFLLCSYLLLLAADLGARPTWQVEIKKADSLLSVVAVELSKVNPSGGLKPATEALSLSRNANYSKGIAKSCFHIGQIFNYLGEYEKSMEYLSLSEQEKYSKYDVILLSEISRIKGQVYYLLGLNKASFGEFRKAHDYAMRIKDDKKMKTRLTSLAYENLSIAYDIIKKMPDSSFYYMEKNNQLLETTDENDTFRNKINLYSLYGQYYATREQYNAAEYYFNKALSLISTYNYPYSSWLYSRWGDMYMQKDSCDLAITFYRLGLENARKNNLKNELPSLYKKISDVYVLQDIEDSAELYQEKYLEMDVVQSDSRLKATEEALAILVREERKLSFEKMRRCTGVVGVIFIAVLLITALIYRQSVKKRKTKEDEVSELKQKLNTTFEEVVKLARNNDSTFFPRFKEVYPEFTGSLLRQHPDLTDSDLQLSAMIFLNFQSKEIAKYLFMTHRSVQTKKNRLRKKLNLSNGTDIYRYFKSLS